MNEIIEELEWTTMIGPVRTARLLGIAYPTYVQYSNESRALPQYHARHIELIMSLSATKLREQIAKHAQGVKRGRRKK